MANKPEILGRVKARVALLIAAIAMCAATWFIIKGGGPILGRGGGRIVDLRVQQIEGCLRDRVRKGMNTIAELLMGLDEFLDSDGERLRLVVTGAAITIEIPGRDGVWGTGDDEFKRVARDRR